MTWVATAVIGSAIIGAVGSSRASGKAVDAAERGQDILAASRDEARGDVNRLFPRAREESGQGFDQFRDFLGSQVLPQQVQPFQQGNFAAQQQVGRGLNATQAAILGLAPDLSGFGARSFQAPQFNLPQEQPQQQPFQFNPQQNQGITDGLNSFRGLGGSSGGLDRFSNFNFQRSM